MNRTKMTSLAFASLLAAIAAVSSAEGGNIFPFDPVDLSAQDESSLRLAARQSGGRAAIRSIQAGALLGDVAMAIVEFAPYEQRPDHSLRMGVFCSYQNAAWACGEPYRIVTLLNEASLVEIELRGDVSVEIARKVLAFVRARDGSHLVALTAIECKSSEEYRVDVTYTDGGGVSSITQRDLARMNY
jgi:hypothetical protein